MARMHQEFVGRHGQLSPDVEGTEVARHARELSSAVHAAMEYVSGSTNVLTAAEEVLGQRRGVCHLRAYMCQEAQDS